LLYEDETILWRFALPRAGWWRKAQRARLPTRPLSQSQIKRDESLKRQAWVQYRSWRRVTSGVLLRGYPKTFSHCYSGIMQPPGGNETQGDRRERVYSAEDGYDGFVS